MLTAKQAAFCREYMVDCNATQAAIRAGYSPRTANEQGARALANVSIQAEIARLMAERSKRVEVTADYVLRALIENVQRSMQAMPVLDAEGNPIGQYRYNGAVANKSLELIGRHLGMFTDKHEVEHAVQLPDNLLAQLLQRVESERQVIIDAECIERVALDHGARERNGSNRMTLRVAD